MNPRPIQTGTQIFHFSRTFRHYILTGTLNYGQDFNQQWSDIPYQHICASLKPRDWQMINVLGKRWRILSCGFNMMHIIPFENSKSSTGGAVGPDITYNLLPYLESYIDKGYQLPTVKLYDNTDLPNRLMTQNSGNQNTAALKQITLEGTTNRVDWDDGSINQWYKGGATAAIRFDLMNSKEWGTIQPTQEFSFEWKPNADDMWWRHGCTIETTSTFSNDYQPAHPLGRWDGGAVTANTGGGNPNINMKNNLAQMVQKPAPTCIVRPVTLHDSTDAVRPLVFQVLIKYHSTIEVDVNDIGNQPLFNSYVVSPGVEDVYNIYGGKRHDDTKKSNYVQWSGANYLGKAATGPAPTGWIF